MTDAEYLALLEQPQPAPTSPQDKSDDEYLVLLNKPAYTPSAAAFNPASRVQRQGATPTYAVPKSYITETIGGVTEPIAKMATGMVAKPVSEVAGIAAMFADYLGGMGGDPLAFKKHVQESLTYQPRTAAGQSGYNPLNAVPEAIGNVVNAATTGVGNIVRGEGDNLSPRGMAANAVEEAIPQALGFIGMKKGVNIANQLTPEAMAARAQKASATDWNRAGTIEAANIGRSNNLVMNPSIANPSAKATIDNLIVNSDYFNAAGSIANAKKFNDMARKEAGIPENTPLTEEAFKRAKFKNAAAYREAESIGQIKPVPELVHKINSIDIPDMMGTSEVDVGRIKKLTDSVSQSLNDGVDAKELMATTQSLRKDAKKTFDTARMQQVDPTDWAVAKAKMEVADLLDQNLSANASEGLAKRLNDARVKFAQIYNLERATNLATHQIDPMIFAAEMAGRHKLTGVAAEMGQFAANMPEVSNVLAKKVGSKIHMPVRSGPAGTFGYAAGSLFGAPVATSAVSAGLASVGGKLRLKKMLSEEYQAKNTNPLDRRLPLPEEPGLLTGNQ